MILFNQDRDLQMELYGDETFATIPIMACGDIMGINLYVTRDEHEMILLGTFDSPQEAIDEIENIQSCEDMVYLVNGYDSSIYEDEEIEGE